MIRAARLLAAVLPLAGLAALWAQSDRTYHSGTEWEVPIMGYDPRDYLRGHYVEFSYDWPGLPGSDILPSALCLEGAAPVIDRVTTHAAFPSCAHPVMARASDIYGLDGLFRGRLYLGQNRAEALQSELQDRDQRGQGGTRTLAGLNPCRWMRCSPRSILAGTAPATRNSTPVCCRAPAPAG